MLIDYRNSVSNRNIVVFIFGISILLAIVIFTTNGLSWHKGCISGTLLEFEQNQSMSLSDIRDRLKKLQIGQFNVWYHGSTSNVIIHVDTEVGLKSEDLSNKVQESLNLGLNYPVKLLHIKECSPLKE